MKSLADLHALRDKLKADIKLRQSSGTKINCRHGYLRYCCRCARGYERYPAGAEQASFI